MSDTSNKLAHSVPATLPDTVEGLLERRRIMRQRTLNDYVDDIHVALWPTAEYRGALEAVYDEDAIEGSLAADNFTAATMIREFARINNVPQVANKKLATIVKALNVVTRRYSISRNERAKTIAGVYMGNNATE